MESISLNKGCDAFTHEGWGGIVLISENGNFYGISTFSVLWMLNS